MDIMKDIELVEYPVCHNGVGILEEESDYCFYVSCYDCGCHTAETRYETPDQREAAAKMAAHMWNIGKVITHG